MAEESLYDGDGSPVAYIAEDRSTIYTWDGIAVAYLVDSKIFGWNGRHLGCFENGVIYDDHGSQCGYVKARCPSITSLAPIKTIKSTRSVKSVRSVPSMHSLHSNSRSRMSLAAFLAQGD